MHFPLKEYSCFLRKCNARRDRKKKISLFPAPEIISFKIIITSKTNGLHSVGEKISLARGSNKLCTCHNEQHYESALFIRIGTLSETWHSGVVYESRERVNDVIVRYPREGQDFCCWRSGGEKCCKYLPIKGGSSEKMIHDTNIFISHVLKKKKTNQQLNKDSLLTFKTFLTLTNKFLLVGYLGTCLGWCFSITYIKIFVVFKLIFVKGFFLLNSAWNRDWDTKKLSMILN